MWPRVVVEEEGDGRAYALDPSRSLGMTWDRSLARGDATCGAVFGDGFRLGGGSDGEEGFLWPRVVGEEE